MKCPIDIESAYRTLCRLASETPEDPTMALVHVRAIGMRLGELATTVAEEKLPGFERLVFRLIEKEAELESKARMA